MTKPLTVVACGVLVLIATAVTNVAAGPQAKCLAGKNKCVTEKAGALLECEQKAATPGRPADPNAGGCVDRANARFDGGSDPTMGCFERLENTTPNDCFTFDDTASVEMLVDACVAEIVATIDPASIDHSRCGVGKKKCAAKTLKSILKCHQKAEMQFFGNPNAPSFNRCLDKAKAKLDGGSDPTRGCFEKLENQAGNDCLPPLDNTAAVEGIIDNSCVGAFVAALETPTTTTTTTTTVPPAGCAATTGGFCWFLGVEGADCNATCAAHGRGYDGATDSYAGSSGNDANCQAVLGALGTLEAFTGTANLNGIGCVRSRFGICFDGCASRLLRDVTNPTTAGAALPATERACACL